MPPSFLDVDSRGLQAVALQLAATGPEVEKALKSSLVRMAQWLRGKSAKGLAQTLGIQQKVIRRRLKAFRLEKWAGGSRITLWYGLNPIALIHLGARQNSRGVRASGGRMVASAFIAKGQVFKRDGKARTPITKQEVDIEDQATDWIADHLVASAEFHTIFMKVFERELKWQTHTP